MSESQISKSANHKSANQQSASQQSGRPCQVLFLTQAFPRDADDLIGAFLMHLGQRLAAEGVAVRVLAPHAAGLPDEETLGGLPVRRFRYAPAACERLAYRGAMHDLAMASWGNRLLLGSFLTSFLLASLAATSRRGEFSVLNPQPSVAASRSRDRRLGTEDWRPGTEDRQLLHAHWWFPAGLVGAVASILSDLPLVVTCHGTDVALLRRYRLAQPLARAVFRRAAAVTTVSADLRDSLMALAGVEAARISVIPMPVHPAIEATLPLPGGGQGGGVGPPTILAVARLAKDKGLDVLLEACSLLRARGLDCRLALVGEGEEEAALRAQAQRLGLSASVDFLGAVAPGDLAPHYLAADVVVLPSRREGLGLVLVEALFCRRPVIGTRVGGIPDVVADGQTGLLVPPDDPLALAEALARLLHDPALAARLAAAGYEHVRQHFSGQVVAWRMAAVYRQVLDGGQQG
jgi:glycosyltransferase involved in cell wall biosynthesis